MKALIREEGETVTEDMGIPGIDWKNGYPLTAPGWAGGPYRLVQDYVAIADAEVEFEIQERGVGVEHANNPAPQDPAADVQDTIVIDGVTYTRMT